MRNKPNLETLSGPRLRALIDKLGVAHSALTRDLIAAGYGDCRGTDIRRMAAEGHDLAQRATAASDAFHAASDELERRRRWHGADSPIRAAR